MSKIYKTASSIGRTIARRIALSTFTILAVMVLSATAFSQQITVASPISGRGTQTDVWIRAHNVGCNGLSPVSFGYSIDNRTQLILGITPYDIDATNQTMNPGKHTVHFKSWTRGGLCRVIDTTFTVNPAAVTTTAPAAATTTAPVTDAIPSYAAVSANLDISSNWEADHDLGTPGDSRGSTVYPATTPSDDTGREFYMSDSGGGGERYHISFDKDPTATHFVYDTYVYIEDPSNLQNVEMDMNQVMANGQTVIFGTQCASGSKTWEFTTVKDGGTHWSPSNVPCNPRTWSANTWHHVQIASHRDDNGVVTYDWVNVDGTHGDFVKATGPSALTLGWAMGDLLINFQLDGNNSGDGNTITAYLHKTNIYHW